MVRAIPNNPWRCMDFLERVRPGFAVSAALHVGLLIVLAYFLAFHPGLPMQEPKTEEIVTVIDVPKPPPPALIEVPKVPTFKPMVTRTIKGVDVKIPPFVLPPFDNTSSGPPQTTTSIEPPAQAVIVNPTPIYRGGLIYPDRAAEMGKEGYVDFDFIIEPDGTVGDPHVVAEVPDGIGFASAAKKAFPKWRFNPMMKDGHPVAAPAHIRVSFKLN
jgi:periplasmic protein TonB